jgi:hypothetical protein
MTFAPPSALLDILSYKRPAFGKTDNALIRKFILPLRPSRDKMGNHWIRVGDLTRHPILWSCHTDTMHHTEGRQSLSVCPKGVITLHPTHKRAGNCLGADDGAGVWLMTEMIKAQVPGLYIFHRAEEKGCIGSKYIAKNLAARLKDIKFAIALDRRGTTSVITHQFCGMTASKVFAQQMADLLGGDFAPDDTGLYTDTASYAKVIPECTNLSVGYSSEHGPTESLDSAFIVSLRDKLIATDWSVLEVVRKPGEDDWYQSYRTWPKNKKTKGYYGEWEDDEWEASLSEETRLRWFVEDHPGFIAEMLGDAGVTTQDLKDEYARWAGLRPPATPPKTPDSH